MGGQTKFIVTNRYGVTKLYLGEDGLWRNDGGTVFALRSKGDSVDPVNQCGVYPFVIPQNMAPKELNAACTVHDYMYESPAYQLFHTRKEADKELARLIGLPATGFWGVLAVPFWALSRLFGGRFWENKKTDN